MIRLLVTVSALSAAVQAGLFNSLKEKIVGSSVDSKAIVDVQSIQNEPVFKNLQARVDGAVGDLKDKNGVPSSVADVKDQLQQSVDEVRARSEQIRGVQELENKVDNLTAKLGDVTAGSKLGEALAGTKLSDASQTGEGGTNAPKESLWSRGYKRVNAMMGHAAPGTAVAAPGGEIVGAASAADSPALDMPQSDLV